MAPERQEIHEKLLEYLKGFAVLFIVRILDYLLMWMNHFDGSEACVPECYRMWMGSKA